MDSVWRLIHIIAAAYWLGGLIFLGMVAAIAGRSLEPTVFRALMARAGRAFLVGSLIAGAALAGSGVAMAAGHLHGVGELGTTQWGRTLAVKSALAIVLVLLAAIHSFAGSRSTRRWIVASRALSPVILIVTLGVFYLAVRLTEM